MKLKVKNSKIHGKGVFAEDEILAMEYVGKLITTNENGVKELSTLTMYMNHSPMFNVQPLMEDDEVVFLTTRKILPGEELLIDYSHSHELGFVDSWYLSKIAQVLLKEDGFKDKVEDLIKEG